MYPASVTETHFVFGGMHIDVYPGLGHLQKQHKYRVATVKHDVTVGLADGVPDQLVTYRPAVDIKVLHVRLAA